MIEWEIHLDLMVLQYVKKNKLTVDQFEKHVNDISYGFDLETGNHEDTYRNKRMITSGDNYNLVLTSFGEAILKKIVSTKITKNGFKPLLQLEH